MFARLCLMMLTLLLPLAAHAEQTAALIGDVEAGKKVFRRCASCHQIGEGAKNRTGPQLNNIFDRKAGTIEGFTYSRGLARAGADGLRWDLERLDAYLTNPKLLVSDTNMNFAGLKKPKDRHNVIAYLRAFSDRPQDIPEAAPTAIAEEVQLSPEVLALVGDPAFGEYLSSECLTCHQRSGEDKGIPSITGWMEEDFVLAMHAYKQKLRDHPVMQMMAGRLSEEEIAALAAYFNGLN